MRRYASLFYTLHLLRLVVLQLSPSSSLFGDKTLKNMGVPIKMASFLHCYQSADANSISVWNKALSTFSIRKLYDVHHHTQTKTDAGTFNLL